ncbi:Gaa1-like protein [Vararia minispora EC-137]|uniref:Gaa1-like protein n=1 Tax=Vararia minispora EC-137 TaxID=1314806 RepID=A0ACB8QKJ0_9AGAM|nr:Gaa1-like protein [Vararia minispora EC-137]
MASLRQRMRRMIKGDPIARLKRRRKTATAVYSNHAIIQTALLVIGLAWMLIIPSDAPAQWTYIDENALQPGQVNTYWNWGDVGRADNYLRELEELRDRNASSRERAEYFSTEFAKLGLPTEIQQFNFTTSMSNFGGENSYAVFSAPRASGTEAIIISASWISHTGGYNLRGIATLMSLASFLKGYSHWSKNLIFVIPDGYLEGMQAWLCSYHGATQKTLDADPLNLPSGVVWTSLNIDYPGHSFSHLGVFREGINGRLPNQDLINSFRIISYTASVPVVLYDHIEPSEYPGRQQLNDFLPSWIPQSVLDNPSVLEYAYRARNVLKHFGYQARGKASGIHGLLHQYRIDAITLYAVPSNGPHGFYALGKILESTLRTMNNLLERLHASFFFYIMPNAGRFLKIGVYLPSAILVGAALMFGGLGEWTKAGWLEIVEVDGEKTRRQWVSRSRDLVPALQIVLATHILGAGTFWAVQRSLVIRSPSTYLPLIALVTMIAPLAILLLPVGRAADRAPLHMLLKATTLCLASTAISVTSVLNFSLASLLAIVFGIPLTFAGPACSFTARLLKYFFYAVLAVGWMWLHDEVRDALLQWEMLGVWLAPVVCMLYTPFMIQAGIASLYSLG